MIGNLVIAQEVTREDFPTVRPDTSLSEALELFLVHKVERLPVVLSADIPRLVGTISKTDLLLTFAHYEAKKIPRTHSRFAAFKARVRGES